MIKFPPAISFNVFSNFNFFGFQLIQDLSERLMEYCSWFENCNLFFLEFGRNFLIELKKSSNEEEFKNPRKICQKNVMIAKLRVESYTQNFRNLNP